jgi:hypothetical protein
MLFVRYCLPDCYKYASEISWSGYPYSVSFCWQYGVIHQVFATQDWHYEKLCSHGSPQRHNYFSRTEFGSVCFFPIQWWLRQLIFPYQLVERSGTTPHSWYGHCTEAYKVVLNASNLRRFQGHLHNPVSSKVISEKSTLVRMYDWPILSP